MGTTNIMVIHSDKHDKTCPHSSLLQNTPTFLPLRQRHEMDSLYRRFGRSAVSARAPRDVPETTPLGRIPKISQVLKEQFLLTTWARKERQAAANILFPGSEVGEGFLSPLTV
ncbi:hypothetical protein CDAR_72871 [Caerostris darwini]|uniref:Uncharacterized protein n=1 Tax=Caerostris darwini TaxID=1538125 RepID=A0AAV4T1L5_9ARAC|nr:hypothetical protein CDAR_72871 [Caerostris darwini]